MSNQRKARSFITSNGLEITQSEFPFFSGSLRVKQVENGYILTGAMKLPFVREDDAEGQEAASVRAAMGKNPDVKAILSPLGMQEAITANIEEEGLFQEVRHVVSFYKADLKMIAGVLRILDVDDINDLGNLPCMKAEYVYAKTMVKVPIVGFLNEDKNGNEYFRLSPQSNTELFAGDRVKKFSRRKASSSTESVDEMEVWSQARSLLDELKAEANKVAKPASASGIDKDIDDMID